MDVHTFVALVVVYWVGKDGILELQGSELFPLGLEIASFQFGCPPHTLIAEQVQLLFWPKRDNIDILR
jgi:hypothetical protein